MELILWRHADACEATAGQDDAERPLTRKGQRQAQRMAQWLNQQLPESTRILVSPALRAQQTAAALERKVKLVPALAPGCTVLALLESARWPDAREPVLVIGHQDTLGLTASHLLAGTTQPWSIRKGAIWWICSRERDGIDRATLRTVLSADRV